MDRHDRVLAIVLAAEHLLDLAALDQAGEFLDTRRELAGDVLSLRRPVDEHTQVVALGLERGNQLDFFFDAAAALKDFLRLDLVVPEIGRGGAGFYLCELVSGAGRLKDSSGGRRRVSRGPDSGGSRHRER
jgi:hypothetical protein